MTKSARVARLRAMIRSTDTVKKKRAGISLWHTDIRDVFTRSGAQIPAAELAVFCNKLAFMLGAGVSLQEALPVLVETAGGRMLRAVLPEVHNRILQGESFARACTAVQVFPFFMCGFIRVGEETARLGEVCTQLGDYYQRRAQATSELTAALLYPIAVLIMMAAVMVVAVAMVLPGYAAVFAASDVALPALTRALLAFSQFIAAHGVWLGVGLVAFTLALLLFLRSERGISFRAWVQLKFPLYRMGVNVQIAQVLSLMLSAGQTLSAALPLCAQITANPRIARDLTKAATAIATGRPLWASLDDIPYLDPLLINLARIGEASGTLTKTLTRAHAHFDVHYNQQLRRLNKLVEPIITLAMGIGLALVMLAIVLPTFELATVV